MKKKITQDSEANKQSLTDLPTKDQHKDFFIGYKKVPDASRRFFLLSVPVCLAAGTALGYLLARSQTKPDATIWGANTVSLDGLLVEKPYPHLLVDNPKTAEGYDAVFLVSRGKRGAQQFAQGKANSRVRVQGRIVSRHDTRSNYLLEVRDIQSLAQAEVVGSRVEQPLDLGAHKMRGQIVDSKCYFGVMKPAEGLTHKACASLCVRGGIPAFFVPFDKSPDRVTLVVNEKGQADPALLLPHILDPVEVTGRLLSVNNHYQLQLASANIKGLVSLKHSRLFRHF